MRKAEEQATGFFAGLQDVLTTRNGDVEGQEASPWLFGTPTVLDAHAATFVARMLDVGRESLVPGAVLTWARRVLAGPEWHAVTGGKSTM